MSSEPARAGAAVIILAASLQVQVDPLERAATLLKEDDFEQAASVLSNQTEDPVVLALSGEVAYRRGHFEQAERLYHQAMDMDPNTARANFGLGRLALAKLKIDDAVAFFSRAIELDPDEALFRLPASDAWGLDGNDEKQREQLEAYIALDPPHEPDRLRQVKAMLEVLDVFESVEMGAVEGPDEPSPVEMRKALNLLFVTVTVHGQGPYEFALDTGASQTVISRKLADELSLTPISATIIHGIGGTNRTTSTIYRVEELGLGDLTIRNLPVGTLDDAALTGVLDGILSTAILADYVLTIDYPKGLLEFRRDAACAAGDFLPVWYLNNILLLPLGVEEGHDGNFVLDTGAVTTVLSHRMAASLGVTEETPGSKVNLGVTGVAGFEGSVLRVPHVMLSTAQYDEVFPQIIALDLGEISKMIGTEVAGVIGYDFLEPYRITLDYDRARVRLEK